MFKELFESDIKKIEALTSKLDKDSKLERTTTKEVMKRVNDEPGTEFKLVGIDYTGSRMDMTTKRSGRKYTLDGALFGKTGYMGLLDTREPTLWIVK